MPNQRNDRQPPPNPNKRGPKTPPIPPRNRYGGTKGDDMHQKAVKATLKNARKPLKIVARAIFIGRDGSCGYRKSKTYIIYIEQYPEQQNLWVNKITNSSEPVEYSNIATFLNNWTNVQPVPKSEVKWNADGTEQTPEVLKKKAHVDDDFADNVPLEDDEDEDDDDFDELDRDNDRNQYDSRDRW